MSYIYCFTNLINQKKYIGSTINKPNIRYNQHLYNASHPNTDKYNYPLYQAIRKYGIENFTYEILAEVECSEEEIRQLEKQYIYMYNSISPNGYNQTDNTEHPLNDAKTYQKMSETKRERAKRVALVDEQNNIIEIYRSIVDCAEALGLDERKIGACCRGERRTTDNKKFCWLDEANELIIPEYNKELYKGEPGTTQKQITNRKVAKIDMDSNQIIAVYDTIALASRENNCDNSGIAKVCRNKRQSCGGFKWKYVDM